jgi:hypothetical protein
MNLEGAGSRVSARSGAGRLNTCGGRQRPGPLVANRLLAGRTPEEALRLLPNVFSDLWSRAIHRRSSGPRGGRGRDPLRARYSTAAAANSAARQRQSTPSGCCSTGRRLLRQRASRSCCRGMRSLLLSAPLNPARPGVRRGMRSSTVIETRMLGQSRSIPGSSSSLPTEWLQWARLPAARATATMLGALRRASAVGQPRDTVAHCSRPSRSQFLEGMGRRALTDRELLRHAGTR